MLKYLLSLIVALMVVGCGTKTVYVKQMEYVPVKVDSSLLETQQLPTPPEKKVFLQKTPAEQRNLLATYSLGLQTLIEQLNQQLVEINTVLTSHEKRVKTLNIPKESQ